MDVWCVNLWQIWFKEKHQKFILASSTIIELLELENWLIKNEYLFSPDVEIMLLFGKKLEPADCYVKDIMMLCLNTI